jgi:transcriptional regulator with PAS, ATPase and Fis domain
MRDYFRDPFLDQVEGFSASPDEHLNECIARIESLKIKILGNPFISAADRTEFFHELDTLRGAYMHLTTLTRRSTARVQKVGESKRRHADVPELAIEGILGQNTVIIDNLSKIAKIAPTDVTVLLEGETGAGKELFARIIHLNSNRAKFVAVNCGAVPSGIIESELFGHVKGAFTGATHDRKGKFEEANGGTIFLDEIGDLEPQAQVKMLRTLDVGEIQRVGSDKVLKTDVRVIAATNKNLEQMVEDGQFREDLFFRMNICPIWIPPLRERRDEIEVLFNYFIQQNSAEHNIPQPEITDELRVFIYKYYPFPGNIRELKNLAQYITYIFDGNPVSLGDLPIRYKREFDSLRTHKLGKFDGMMRSVRDQSEKDLLCSILKKHGGDVPSVCQELGLSRSRVYQLMKKYDVKAGAFKAQRGATTH